MRAGAGRGAAPADEERQRRNTERYLDRPSLGGLLLFQVVPCLILALLINKIATSRSSAATAWSAGLAIGAGLAAAAACASGASWRAVVRSHRRWSMQPRLALPGLPQAKKSVWPSVMTFIALIVASLVVALAAAGYLLGGRGNPGVQHPSTLFQMSALGYATTYCACCVVLLAWFTARPYFGLGPRRWRLALRGQCPGPVRVHTRPAGVHDGHESGPCYVPICVCMWAGHPHPVGNAGAEAAMAEARRHSPNAHAGDYDTASADR